MMRKWVLALAVTMSALFFTGNAYARGEASIYIGRTFTSALFLENMTTFGGTVGAYGGVVGFEFGLEYSPSSNFQVPFLDLGASLTNIMGNLVVQIPIGEFYPYGTVGYGVSHCKRGLGRSGRVSGDQWRFQLRFRREDFLQSEHRAKVRLPPVCDPNGG